jgi:hypothetical protein
MDTPFYSKHFHQHLRLDFSLHGAREMALQGELERWIFEFPTCDPRWTNPGLVNGLRTKPHHIHGLMEMPVRVLEDLLGHPVLQGMTTAFCRAMPDTLLQGTNGGHRSSTSQSLERAVRSDLLVSRHLPPFRR